MITPALISAVAPAIGAIGDLAGRAVGGKKGLKIRQSAQMVSLIGGMADPIAKSGAFGGGTTSGTQLEGVNKAWNPKIPKDGKFNIIGGGDKGGKSPLNIPKMTQEQAKDQFNAAITAQEQQLRINKGLGTRQWNIHPDLIKNVDKTSLESLQGTIRDTAAGANTDIGRLFDLSQYQ